MLGAGGRRLGDRCGDAQVPLNRSAGVLQAPAAHAHQQVHARHRAALMVLATAAIAEATAGSVVAIPAVAIGAAACGTGLMAIGQLLC